MGANLDLDLERIKGCCINFVLYKCFYYNPFEELQVEVLYEFEKEFFFSLVSLALNLPCYVVNQTCSDFQSSLPQHFLFRYLAMCLLKVDLLGFFSRLSLRRHILVAERRYIVQAQNICSCNLYKISSCSFVHGMLY